jgi:ribosomal protein S6--L-glutamate ligase
MLRLAVPTKAETYERMREPLAERGIEVGHVRTDERTVPIDDPPFDEYDVGFVFPPRLAEGGVTDALLAVPWVNGREAILRSRHKGEALARLSRAGLPTPETVVVSDPVDESDLKAAFEQFEPPVVVKPNATTRGVGVAKAHDLDSFLGICDYLDLVHDYRATGDQSFLVQEFLPDARDYRAMRWPTGSGSTTSTAGPRRPASRSIGTAASSQNGPPRHSGSTTWAWTCS